MGLLSNRIDAESLKPGDHIYSWRTAYIYAHHGIYMGNDEVIHFTRGQGEEMGTGTVLDLLLASSAPARLPCSSCDHRRENSGGVVLSCLLCFLAGGVLYRFEYGVSPAMFCLKARGGTCTTAPADEHGAVIRRAGYLLRNGFRGYNAFNSNCEDFAIYCKTGLIAVVGQSGQAISLVGGPLAAAFSTPVRLMSTNIYGMAAVGIGLYCASRYLADIGNRMDVVKVPVEELTSMLIAGTAGRVTGDETFISSPVDACEKGGSSLSQ